jgi:hypothetical protein
MNPRKRPAPIFESGDIVSFKARKKRAGVSSDSWIDQDENFISPGSVGLILEVKWVSYEDDEAWEYDVHLPSMGIITKGWGDYALVPVSQRKRRSRKKTG